MRAVFLGINGEERVRSVIITTTSLLSILGIPFFFSFLENDIIIYGFSFYCCNFFYFFDSKRNGMCTNYALCGFNDLHSIY